MHYEEKCFNQLHGTLDATFIDLKNGLQLNIYRGYGQELSEVNTDKLSEVNIDKYDAS